MVVPLNPSLRPKRGGKLIVLIIARISTIHQDPRSLDDQQQKIKSFLQHHYDGEIDFIVLSSQGSGEHLDRKELIEAEDHIASGRIDLVMAEDLARICRRHHALSFCELCLDHDTRLIAINDRVDTEVDGWQDSAFISAWHHERSNRDTSKRIRRTLRNRFMQGGVFQFSIYGQIKPTNAKIDADVLKDPTAERIYDRWFSMLEEGATYAEVADWLNSENVPTGPFCDQRSWDGKMVARITHNPMPKGMRQRNNMMSRRINNTGHYHSVKAPPEELLKRDCSHLVFIEPARYDRVIRLLTERNKKYRRTGYDGVDTRKGVPKKRSIWPGQHLICGICGRLMRYGAHGQNDHLFCAGADDYLCWNGISVDGPLARLPRQGRREPAHVQFVFVVDESHGREGGAVWRCGRSVGWVVVAIELGPLFARRAAKRLGTFAKQCGNRFNYGRCLR